MIAAEAYGQTRAHEAAETVLLLREECATPEEIMAELRREFPDVTTVAVFRAVSEMDVVRGRA